MESDGESVSKVSKNETAELAVAGSSFDVGQTLGQSESNRSQESLTEGYCDDYYEVISADGSIDEDDLIDDIDNVNRRRSASTNDGLSAGLRNRSPSQAYSVNDFPFVPKCEFSPDQYDDNNSSNCEALHENVLTSTNITRPDKHVKTPLPNIKQTQNDKFKHLGNTLFTQETLPSTSLKKGSRQTALENKSKINKFLSNASQNPKEKSNNVDWLDENGDPVPGAFDYVKPEEETNISTCSKIEYVFSVRDKKDFHSEKSDVNDSTFVINQNILHKNVLEKVGVHLETQCVSDILQDDEEKKLYEASKTGAEYKSTLGAALLPATNILPSTSKGFTKRDIVKTNQITRFRRNRFTDIKKEDETKPEESSEQKPIKSTEEVALESQAVTEILKEVQRGQARAREYGPLGWQKCPVPVTNKTFLRNTLVSTLREPYRPPSKRGRFHLGLKKDVLKKDITNREDDDNSRSDISSRSSCSRSCSSYSCSHSGSSCSDDEMQRSCRDRSKHYPHGERNGPWHRGHEQYYDEAWAAYDAPYGYPWYGPEAVPMYYGTDGWPVDPYTAMYYGDPQSWMEYQQTYYGPPNFNMRRGGRGFRGMGRGDRGRRPFNGGGYDGEFSNYDQTIKGSREFSPARNQRELSHSWSRDRSKSRSRINSVSSRVRSRSRPRSRSMSRYRSHDRSVSSRSDSKVRSDTESNKHKKKKKKEKKKKKKKKHKKSKHKQKSEYAEYNEKNEKITSQKIGEKITVDDECNKIDDINETSDNLRKADVLRMEKYRLENKKPSANAKDTNKMESQFCEEAGEITDRKVIKKDYKNVEDCSSQILNRQAMIVKQVKNRVDKIHKPISSKEIKESSYSRSIVEKTESPHPSSSQNKKGKKEHLIESGNSKVGNIRNRKVNDDCVKGSHNENTERGKVRSGDEKKKIFNSSGQDGSDEVASFIVRTKRDDNQKGITDPGIKDKRVAKSESHDNRIIRRKKKCVIVKSDILEKTEQYNNQIKGKETRIIAKTVEDDTDWTVNHLDRKSEFQNKGKTVDYNRNNFEEQISNDTIKNVRHKHQDCKNKQDRKKSNQRSKSTEADKVDDLHSLKVVVKNKEKVRMSVTEKQVNESTEDSTRHKYTETSSLSRDRGEKSQCEERHAISIQKDQKKMKRRKSPGNYRINDGVSIKIDISTNCTKYKERELCIEREENLGVHLSGKKQKYFKEDKEENCNRRNITDNQHRRIDNTDKKGRNSSMGMLGCPTDRTNYTDKSSVSANKVSNSGIGNKRYRRDSGDKRDRSGRQIRDGSQT